jgi:tRNA nucleotidyltransferase (CCA-adding enzyme)
MINYPSELESIFETFELFKIEPIIVGGFIRDQFLGIYSKDIDIELYGVASLSKVEEILSQFGSINSVGKSFGVCKLRYKRYDLDFSLPRRDNKIDKGHKGFNIVTDENLDFQTAASRRDFTINAMGFDVRKKEFLDPFAGLADLKKKILRAIDIEKFDEDPLRVLRAVQLSSRFDLQMDEMLFLKCKEMINSQVLCELPSERILGEFEKIILKSPLPSRGFHLLESLGAFSFFKEFQNISREQKESVLESLDTLSSHLIENEKEKLLLMLALLCRYFSFEEIDSFLNRLTHENKLCKDVKNIIKLFLQTPLKEFTHYDIYLLATKIKIRIFVSFLLASLHNKEKTFVAQLQQKAVALNVYEAPLMPFVHGKDLINLGLKPSPEFSKILNMVYEAQMQEEFFTKEEAIHWTKKYLLAKGDSKN